MRRIYQLVLLGTILQSILLYSCASSGVIEGGPKDTEPPKLIQEKSSEPNKLKTNDRKFIFTFDEYVEVRDVIKQVQISPPLVYIPKVKSRGKEVVFEFNFKEVLRDSTTYTINFGEAIGDLNEGNKYKNFSYVFSTGDVIDSMSVRGIVAELDKGSGLTDVIVMLYDDLSDSAIVKKKPSYSLRVDDKGVFHIKNIKNGQYRIYALKDENNTLTYEEATEQIAFTDDYIIWSDSAQVSKNLTISLPETKLRIAGKSKQNNYGSIRLKLNHPAYETIAFTTEPPLDFTSLEEKEDSLILHYITEKKIDSLTWNLPMEQVKIAVPAISTKPDTFIISPAYNISTIVNTDTLFMRSNIPIKSINKDLIIAKDTNKIIKLNGLIYKDMMLKITGPILENKDYDLILLPGAVEDIFGNKNDSISLKFTTVKREILSKIEADIIKLDSNYTYIVSLMKDGRILQKDILSNTTKQLIKYNDLLSGQYEVSIIEDKNRNGRYDGARFWTKQQAEIKKTFKLDNLKEYWKLETTINFKE